MSGDTFRCVQCGRVKPLIDLGDVDQESGEMWCESCQGRDLPPEHEEDPGDFDSLDLAALDRKLRIGTTRPTSSLSVESTPTNT
jgi:hypothetical protein